MRPKANVLLIALIISFVFVLISGAYLLIYDSVLYSTYLHWLGLLLFTVINTALVLYLLYSKNRMSTLAIATISGLWFIAMLLDALLPASYGAVGAAYLFGFGAAGTYSIFSTSLAFTILFVFTALECVSALVAFGKKDFK